MDETPQIPGYHELDDWPAPPAAPMRIANFDVVRGGGYVLDIVDAKGTRFPFFFDRFLGRLCYGSGDEHSDDKAFVTSGSKLSSDVFEICRSAINEGIEDGDRIGAVIDRAVQWSRH